MIFDPTLISPAVSDVFFFFAPSPTSRGLKFQGYVSLTALVFHVIIVILLRGLSKVSVFLVMGFSSDDARGSRDTILLKLQMFELLRALISAPSLILFPYPL